ncbi:1,2-phenylacetyl-CoA epoxidase, subunit E [Kordia antarctica]|uniref:1,2-phenylacetyl-CoA epoxidase, subunit E n=1 Tax=Kordia antarctica TaxID=1218801 RepID=A0A7L4ZLI7_9FLAO|nr:ferredoxin--NADP reductase [Kordia antarctica]QHI37435.1 1,2-phenylacetyl-CoA epoxidase, subunit E [Kordia antarctica]
MSGFHSLEVRHIHRETPSAVSVEFHVPEVLQPSFSFKAGQHITIKTTLNGKEIRRSYSLCATPKENKIKVAIKEIENGTFSKYANQELTEGTILNVHPPEGKFVYTPSSHKGNIALFAAGSGITPMMSILKTALEYGNTVALLYGNKSTEETIFHDELIALADKFPNFYLKFVYSQSRTENALTGRIDGASVNYVLKNQMKATDFSHYYICGPEEMIATVSDTLTTNEVAKETIHFELFTSSAKSNAAAEAVSGKTTISITVDDEDFTFDMDASETILDAALKQKIDAPYSCQGGICSSCICRVTEGKAIMEKNQILTDSELAEGMILACQAHPVTATIAIDFDDI